MAEAALDGVPDGEAAASGVDSEYANAGVADPRVLITTSTTRRRSWRSS